MKKWISLILSTVMISSIVGCAKPPEPSAPASEAGASETAKTGKSASDLTVAGVVFQEDQFMQLLQKGYEAAAKKYGAKVLLSNTNNDQAKESELINTYVTQKVDGLAIAPLNEVTSIQALKTADSAGMKIAISNTNLKAADFAVGGYTSDNYNLGEQTGKEARKFIEEKLNGKAKIAVLQFKSLLVDQSTQRYNGFVDQLKDMPGVEIVADQDAWLQDKAIQAAGDILTAQQTKGGVDIIWAANDGGTIGATMAVKNAGLTGKTFVFGTDAGEQQAAMLKDQDNILQCVTGQDPYNIGYNTMEVLIKNLTGEATASSESVIVNGITLTRQDTSGIDAFSADLKAKMGN